MGISSEKSVYLIDFRPIIEKTKKHADYFYFYPKEMIGFIESCVLSSQRTPEDYASRDWSIFMDMKGALHHWTQLEEEAAWRQGREMTFGKAYMQEQTLDFAMSVRLGAEIDSFVLYQMSAVRAAHGDYAVDQNSFRWTEAGALMMDVYYGK